MKNWLSKILFIGAGIFTLAGSVWADYSPGPPTGFLNDYAGVLDAEQKQSLEAKLVEFEKSTGHEIAAVIISDLEGDTIENFAEKLFKEWGLGKKGKDNGVLILVAKDNREMRIEVGYGLEGALTDAQANWIINKIMKPAFQNNDFYQGLNEAADKIISATQGENIPSEKISASQNHNFNPDWIIGLGFFGAMWLAAILGRSKSWWLGGALGGLAGIITGLIKGFFYFGLMAIIVLLPAGLLFDYLVSKRYQKGKSQGHLPWWTGGGWGGGKGGGFGGFGGGLSGGGGSSGRW